VLSSDGVRKSCATDADFLQLCAQLCSIHDPADLTQGLEQITHQGSGDDVSVAMGQWQGAPAPAATDPPIDPTGKPSPANGRRRAAAISLVTLAILALLSGGGWWLWRHRPPGAQAPRPEVPAPVTAESARQCAQPERLRATLNQRRAQFRQLLNGGDAEVLLAAAGRDPLGALIAASRLGRLPTCAALQRELALQWRSGRMPPGNTSPEGPAPMPRSQP
jgi:hypothetical protein